jgi:hypothetical protein
MQNVSRYRALGSLCRQQAAYNPAQSWELLAKAEHWEHLAAIEMSSHFEECNANRAGDPAKTPAIPDAGDTRWKRLSPAEASHTGGPADFIARKIA